MKVMVVLILHPLVSGIKIKLEQPNQFLSFGINGGYLFGKQDYSTRRSIFNDHLLTTVAIFKQKHHMVIYISMQVCNIRQYLKAGSFLTIGVHGNWKQN